MSARHCWQDYEEYTELLFGASSSEHIAALTGPGKTCMREVDHDGAHEWTDDRSIGLSF